MKYTTSTEIINGRRLHLTDHGDHVTTWVNLPNGEWVRIIAQPISGLGVLSWSAYLWFRNNLAASSHWCATPAVAAIGALDQLLADLLVESAA